MIEFIPTIVALALGGICLFVAVGCNIDARERERREIRAAAWEEYDIPIGQEDYIQRLDEQLAELERRRS